MIAILKIYTAFGFGLAAVSIVFVYLVAWEIVAELFSSAGRKLPGPFRVMLQIVEEIIEIIAPGP